MKLRIASLAIVLALFAGSAAAQSIGIFWDANGATCSVQQNSGSPGTCYLLAVLGGGSAGGITGAEFRVDNFPSGTWFASPTRNPAANIDVGSPLGTGCNIAFPSCQAGSGGVLLLYTVGYFATSQEVDRRITIQRHTNPSNPNFMCPLHVLCDAPVFTKLCVGGGTGIVNGPNCTVGVEPKSWSTVKSLYNH
jgi:hypothetical protein